MTAVTTFRAATPRVPWRMVALLAVLLLTFVIGALIAGARRDRGPAPAFGPATNGSVAYAANGDIYTADPTTGASRLLVGGPTVDVDPQWSRDGERVVFRRHEADGIRSVLMVADADGSEVVQITPEAVLLEQEERPEYSFSPDGRSVLYLAAGQAWLAEIDGSGVSRVGELAGLSEVAFRPPDGRQIAFVVGESIGIANADGTKPEFLVLATTGVATNSIRWSPDGTTLAYTQWDPDAADAAQRFTAHAMAMRLDDRSVRRLDPTADGVWDALPVWSNDGSRVVVVRGYSAEFGDLAAAIVPVDGGRVVTTPRGVLPDGECCSAVEWAPDDSQILWRPLTAAFEPQRLLLIDADTGGIKPAPWGATSDPAFQRRAP